MNGFDWTTCVSVFKSLRFHSPHYKTNIEFSDLSSLESTFFFLLTKTPPPRGRNAKECKSLQMTFNKYLFSD